MVNVVNNWSSASTNETLIKYSEVPGVLHWFNSVFRDQIVVDFLDTILPRKNFIQELKEFTVTTANPDESSTKNGFRIVELEVPGR